MAGDRDLDVAFARARWAGRPKASGWEVAAATGVRGLRLLNESGVFDRFRLTEAHPEAAEVLLRNAAGIPGATAVCADGRVPPVSSAFDYVEVDPYGSPVPFVDAALRAVRPGGVIGATATDMMVLAGAQRGAAERRYGARPVRGRLGPEGGVRILLAYLAREARARGLGVRPLVAYVRDHHVRAYVEVTEGGSPDADTVGEIHPDRWDGPDVGADGPFGPMWLGPLFDPDLVRRLALPSTAAEPRATAQFLDRLREEVEVDRPFYYEGNVLAHRLAIAAPPPLAAILGALRRTGYRAARTHARPEGFRTDAPRGQVEAVVRRLAGPDQSQKARVRA